jgi:sporulation protein YlmC with PRC-barrel domain
MNHYGTLRDYRFADKDADDIRGSDLYGRDDEKLGEIDDVVFDHSTGEIRHVVVDTGGWLSSKKFLVPADRLQPSSKHDDDFQVNLTKQQIEGFPAYNEDDVKDRDRWGDYEKRYDKAWTTAGDVMHREDSVDRIITPRADEMPSTTAGSSSSSGLPSGTSSPRPISESFRQAQDPIKGRVADQTTASPYRTTGSGQPDPVYSRPASAAGETPEIATGGTRPVSMSTPGAARSHLGERWNNFENRLRRDRPQIVGACGVCSVGPKSSVSDVDKKRKVG